VGRGHALTRLSEQATSGAGAKASQASAGTLPRISIRTGNRLPRSKGRVGRAREEALRRERAGGDAFVQGEYGYTAHPWRSMTGVMTPSAQIRSRPSLSELGSWHVARDGLRWVWTSQEPAAQRQVWSRRSLTPSIPQASNGAGREGSGHYPAGSRVARQHKVDSDTFRPRLKLFGNQGVVISFL